MIKSLPLIISLVATTAVAMADEPLTGTVIGTKLCYDYEHYRQTLSVNTADNLFDGDPDTYFATYERSYTWAGLDLGEPHVITKVGWMPRNDTNGPSRVILGMFQGANSVDFLDAVPIFLITEKHGSFI